MSKSISARGDTWLRHLHHLMANDEDRALLAEVLVLSLHVNFTARHDNTLSPYAAFLSALEFVRAEYRHLLRQRGVEITDTDPSLGQTVEGNL